MDCRDTMNLHEPRKNDLTMLSAMAAAGLTSLDAIRNVLGETERPSASDLHRLVETQLVDPDALAAFLADFFRLRLMDRTVVNTSRATAQTGSSSKSPPPWRSSCPDPRPVDRGVDESAFAGDDPALAVHDAPEPEVCGK